MSTSSFSALKTPLPKFGNSGNPNVDTSGRVAFGFSPLKQFNPNSETTVWANPIVMVPVKPLPSTGGGGGTGQAGYSV